MTKAKIQVQVMFDAVLSAALQVKGFDPSNAELALIRKAFDGIFNKAQTAFRKTPQSWCGYARRDGTIDEVARQQCLESAFCRLLHYHNGSYSAYLGTVINATDNLRICAEWFNLTPHQRPANGPRYWQLPEGSVERTTLETINAENNEIARRFADHCDTFCQVLVYLQSQGKTSSAAGDQWRRALGVA